MNWQEYQDAVGKLYKTMNEMGEVRKNITIPDKVTGQPRQIDVWWELKLDTHKINILVDAKKRKEKMDIKDLEEVEGLANAVNAQKIIIVTNNGWTEPTFKRAIFSGIDLRLLSIEDALDLIVPDKWIMCPICKDDCIVMDSDGIIEFNGLWLWWIAGKCRNCSILLIWCQDCGLQELVRKGNERICGCGHKWNNGKKGLLLKLSDSIDYELIDTTKRLNPEFIEQLKGYPRGWTKLG